MLGRQRNVDSLRYIFYSISGVSESAADIIICSTSNAQLLWHLKPNSVHTFIPHHLEGLSLSQYLVSFSSRDILWGMLFGRLATE